MGNAHRVYWLRFHESRRSSSHNPDPSTRARQLPKLGMPGQRSSATPTRSAHEYERTLRFQTLCRTLADVAVWPTSISSRSAHV